MKKIFCLFLAIVILAMQLGVVASAEQETHTENVELYSTVQPRLNSTVGASLDSESWSTIVTDNNWINEYITVTSDTSNDGPFKVKVCYLESGGDITAAKTVYPGGSVTLGPVKWNSGAYKIVGQTLYSEHEGGFTITVKD